MPRPKIRVRSKLTGDVAEIAPEALAHFPDFEPVEAPAEPEAAAEPAEPKPSPSRGTAAKNPKE